MRAVGPCVAARGGPRTVAAGCSGSSPPAASRRRDHRVYAARLAQIDVHRAGRALRGRPTRARRSVQLRRFLRPRHPDPPRAHRPTCSPPRTRRTWPRSVDGGLVSGHPVDVRRQHPDDRRPRRATRRHRRHSPDLAKPGVQVVVCAPQVPCGAATEKVEKADRRHAGAGQRGILGHRRPRQGHLRGGRRRARLRHRRRRAPATRSRAIAFPESRQAVNIYPIAVLQQARTRSTAQRFVDLVTGPQGQRRARRRGVRRTRERCGHGRARCRRAAGLDLRCPR